MFCNNVIIRKDGINFLTYSLEDTISSINEVWFDQDGTPTFSQVFFNSNIGPLQNFKIYKFYSEWTKVFEVSEEIDKYTYSKFGNNICRRDLHNVFLFNGSDFSNFFSTDLFPIYRIQGFGSHNLMVNSFTNNGFSIFNWNGNKWSEEFFVLGTGSVIYPINENLYYFYYENNSEGYTDVVRAFRKE